MNDYRLPSVYGKSRLVLLAVDPYLIHAYWEVAPEDLDKAKEQAGQAQEVLRFYKAGKMANEPLADYFDVEINLQSRNWYVHLWSAEEFYFADLALKTKNGAIVRLVRSQPVQMPRTHPAIAIDQRFMKVESTERRAEIVLPPPPAEHKRPKEAAASPVNELIDQKPFTKPIGSAEIVREKLKSVYASLVWLGPRFKPENAPATKRSEPSTGSPHIDLTAIAESNLPAGLSSASLSKGKLDGVPDSKK